MRDPFARARELHAVIRDAVALIECGRVWQGVALLRQNVACPSGAFGWPETRRLRDADLDANPGGRAA